MTVLHDGHTTVDTTIEPDGRVRMTVSVDNEIVAAPTFSTSNFLAAIQASLSHNGAIND